MKRIHILFYSAIVFLAVACNIRFSDPDTDAVYQSVTRTYILHDDGSTDFHYTHHLKYLTHFSFNRAYGESFIVYNPEMQALKINSAFTTTEDGRIVHSPENAFNEVLPRFAAGAPAFNHLREMVVTHTGLEPDCVVELDYVLSSKKDYQPFLSENIVLAEKSPIRNMEIVVRIPKDKTLHYKLINLKGEPKLRAEKGVKIYTWTFSKLPQLSNEGNQPHDGINLRRLIFSTVSVEEAFKSVPIGETLPAEEIESVAKRLQDKKTEAEKIFALQNIVANEMNTFQVALEHTGYKPGNYNEIWRSNGATVLEKTFFLSSLLDEFGIEAKPVYAIPKYIFDPSVGLLKNNGHPYVYCTIENKPVVISATASDIRNNLLYDMKDDFLVDFNGHEMEFEREALIDTNYLSLTGRLLIERGGKLQGEINAYLKGKNNPYLGYLKDDGFVNQLASEIITNSNIDLAELKTWNDTSSQVQIQFNSEKAGKEQSGYLFLKIPEPALGFNAEHLEVLTEKRNAHLQINGPLQENYQFILTCPPDFELISSTVDTVIQNEMGEIHFIIAVNGSDIEISKRLLLHKKLVNLKEFPAFRELYLFWYGKHNELVLKERKN